MRAAFQILTAIGVGIGIGAGAVRAYNRYKKLNEREVVLDPVDVILSATDVVDESSPAAAKVYALRVFGYNFGYEPDEYYQKDVDMTWLLHVKIHTLPPGHPERQTLIAEIAMIGMTPKD